MVTILLYGGILSNIVISVLRHYDVNIEYINTNYKYSNTTPLIYSGIIYSIWWGTNNNKNIIDVKYMYEHVKSLIQSNVYNVPIAFFYGDECQWLYPQTFIDFIDNNDIYRLGIYELDINFTHFILSLYRHQSLLYIT